MPARRLLLLAIAALGLVSPAPIRARGWENSTLVHFPVPFDLRLVAAETAADLDRDGTAERLALIGKQAVIQTESQIRWQSPPSWQVRQAQITDLNRDGLPEAALLLWRPFKPWPVDTWLPNGGRIDSFHDSNGMSCHIILIGWKQGAFRELWAGSALAAPVARFTTADLAGDGRQYLVTLEGEYDQPRAAPARRLKIWEWNGFGFSLVNELDDSFSLVGTAQTANRQILILSP